ncbi:hypothetical protein LINPERPRIM_LOCUS19651, partial [Linum perenne]
MYTPLEMMNPPNTSIAMKANVLIVLATIMFLPSAPVSLNIPEDIWFPNTNNKYCF